jgi:hypothetical protein
VRATKAGRSYPVEQKQAGVWCPAQSNFSQNLKTVLSTACALKAHFLFTSRVNHLWSSITQLPSYPITKFSCRSKIYASRRTNYTVCRTGFAARISSASPTM